MGKMTGEMCRSWEIEGKSKELKRFKTVRAVSKYPFV